MSNPPGLPDLSQLSSGEKDELIASLYATLLAMEGRDRPAAEATSGAPGTIGGRPEDDLCDIRNRIASAAPSRRSQARIPTPGPATRLLTSRPFLILLVLLGVGFAADFAIGWYERHALDKERRAAAVLRSAAFDGLYVELLRVAYETDGRAYRATLAMQNTGDAPLYILLSPMRVFVQVGLAWQEVPARAPAGTEWGVVELAGTREVSVVFQTDLKGWAELIPGYMHVRIDSKMLISRSSTPKDDLVERANVFYVYLKPQGADDDAIKRKARFSGKPPVFIPMPPH